MRPMWSMTTGTPCLGEHRRLFGDQLAVHVYLKMPVEPGKPVGEPQELVVGGTTLQVGHVVETDAAEAESVMAGNLVVGDIGRQQGHPEVSAVTRG